MSIDTREKRASAIMVGLPFRNLLPVADGVIDNDDKRQVAFLYRTTEEAVNPPGPSSDIKTNAPRVFGTRQTKLDDQRGIIS